MKLFLASILTLSILFAFLLSIFLTVFFILGYIEWHFLILLTILINLLLWLLSPYIGDIVNKLFYKMEFIGIEGLRKKDKKVADFIEEVCKKNKINVPKIGWINDDNPQAFTYGSAAFNARIIFTEGIFTYLDTEERRSVFAHELGHILHRDFIVMSIASTIIQLLYEIYWILTRTKGEKRNNLFIIGMISYVFYWIGTYILLYLSRIREYYADEFAGEETKNPNSLSSALLKIAYGILAKPDKEEEIRLMKSTRSLGLTDYKLVKNTGLIYAQSMKMHKIEYIEKSFLFDLKNPWSFFIELSSTHPLTGKRIKRLCMLANKLNQKPIFDFEKIEKYPVDTKKLYSGFFVDVFVLYLPALIIISGIAYLFYKIFLSSIYQIAIPWNKILITEFSLIAIFGVSIILQTIYKYREGVYSECNVIDLMVDIYASPIRGKPVKLKGKIVGKGIPGYIFSEDMLLEDNTGIIYLNYESLIPVFGNLVFAWRKVNKLIGEPCVATGWFVRSTNSRIELKEIKTMQQTIKGRIKILGILFGSFLVIFGVVLLMLYLI